jgi:hypothetical protein
MGKNYSPIISTNMEHFGIPGVVIELDPEEAEAWGAFEEDAISLEDALESQIDAEVDA